MNLPDEIARLKQLHASGALTDDEFARAKAAVIESQVKNVKAQESRKSGGLKRYFLGWAVTLGLLGMIALLNPGERALQLAEERRIESADVGRPPQPPQFQRLNFFLFSVGTITRDISGGGDGTQRFEQSQYIGFLGRWWLDYPIRTDVRTP